MKSLVSKILILIFALSYNHNLFGQDKIENSSKPKLISESPYGGSEFESSLIDVLRNEIARNPGSRGLIILYCGKKCQYGEIEAHLRGIDLSLRGKGMKQDEFLILNGGFREEFMIEYWIVPKNACFPMPSSTVSVKDVNFKAKYKAKIVPYDCCDNLP